MNTHIIQKDPMWLIKRRRLAQKEFQKLREPSFIYGIGISASPRNHICTHTAKDNVHMGEYTYTPKKKHHTDVMVVSFFDALKDKKLSHILETELFTKTNDFAPEDKKCALMERVNMEAGILVYIPKKLHAGVIDISDSLPEHMHFFHQLIILDEDSSAKILFSERQQVTRDTHISTEIILRKNTRLLYNKKGILKNIRAQEAIYMEEDAFMLNREWWNPGQYTKVSSRAYLLGARAQYIDRHAYDCRGDALLDIHKVITHKAPFTISDVRAHGVARDQGHTVWRGDIIVEASAEKSSAYERADALLLSERAEIDAVPTLETYTDSAKCKHASSITNISPHKQFYAHARGLSTSDASRIITEGFLDSVFTKTNHIHS
jgi:Fe-S cluster assembly scaffold protein SufB